MEQKLNDYDLLRIALAVGILGVGILAAFAMLAPKTEYLDQYNSEGKITLEGTIIETKTIGNITMMKASYQCTVDTILFEYKSSDMRNLSKGTNVTIQGNLNNYKGKKSVIAEKILLR